MVLYFNPRSPCGERLYSLALSVPKSSNFNPRSPCGERHYKEGQYAGHNIFQSTLPMRGATWRYIFRVVVSSISIHAPHAGSDMVHCGTHRKELYFNPRSPCGERRSSSMSLIFSSSKFQSTLPMRGATALSWCRTPVTTFQSTLPMRGATR